MASTKERYTVASKSRAAAMKDFTPLAMTAMLRHLLNPTHWLCFRWTRWTTCRWSCNALCQRRGFLHSNLILHCWHGRITHWWHAHTWWEPVHHWARAGVGAPHGWHTHSHWVHAA